MVLSPLMLFISTCHKIMGRDIKLPDDLFVSLASQGERRLKGAVWWCWSHIAYLKLLLLWN